MKLTESRIEVLKICRDLARAYPDGLTRREIEIALRASGAYERAKPGRLSVWPAVNYLALHGLLDQRGPDNRQLHFRISGKGRRALADHFDNPPESRS